jgi:hypothetical protein
LFAAAAASSLLGGCASTGGAGGGTKGESADVLQKRSVERWDLLIAHKAEKAYDYLSPGFRETRKREVYAEEMNNRGVRWNKVSYGSQDCDGDTCKVHLFVDYKVDMGVMAGKVPAGSPVTETWVKIDGRWYYLPEQRAAKLGGNS